MSKIYGKTVGVGQVLLVLIFAAVGVHAQTYTNFTTIDEPLAESGISGGTYVEGISGSTVVGYFYNGTGRHGFYHVLGTTNYTTLDDPLSTSSSSTNTAAYGISGRNIVGSYEDEKGFTGEYGFLYNMDSGAYYTINDLNGISEGESSSAAYAIDGDNIVGYFVSNARPGDSVLSFLTAFDSSQPSSYNFTSFYVPIPEQVTVTYTNYNTQLTGISGNLVVGAVVDTNGYHLGLVYNLTTGGYIFLTNSADGGIIFPNGIEGNQVVGHYSDPAKNFNNSGFVLALGTTNLIEDRRSAGVGGNVCAGHIRGIGGGLLCGRERRVARFCGGHRAGGAAADRFGADLREPVEF
jgi:hypothetical protein